MKIVTASSGKKAIKLSKNEWETLGKQAGWRSDYDTISIGPVPSDEDCAQIGSKQYDDITLNKMEVKAYIGQLQRMFPNIPLGGCKYVMVRNDHEFGVYYEAGINYSLNYENMEDEDVSNPNADYAFNVENNAPENWDEQAISELEAQGYFKFVPRKG